jgi:hypothetical protein
MAILTQDPTVGQVYAEAPQRIGVNACKVLANGDCYNTGVVVKRPGFEELPLNIDGGGSISSAALHTVAYLGDELVLFAADKVYSWRDDMQEWEERGPWTPLNAEYVTLHDTQPDQFQVGVAYVDGYRAIVWIEATPTQPAYGISYPDGLLVQYVGSARGTLFGTANEVAVGVRQGATTAVVARVDNTATLLRLQAIDGSGLVGGVQSFAITTIASGGLYDMSPVGDSYYVVRVNAGVVSIESFDVDAAGIDGGSVATEFSGALGANHIAITVAQLSDGRAFVAWVQTASAQFSYAWITPGVGVTFTAAITPPNAQTVLGVTCEVIDDDSVRLAVDYETATAIGASTFKVSSYAFIPAPLTVILLQERPACRVIGRPYNAGESAWIPLQVLSGATLGIVLDSDSDEVLAEFAHNGAIGLDGDSSVAIARPYAAPAYDASTGVVEFPHTARMLQLPDDNPDDVDPGQPFGARIPAIMQMRAREACMFPQQFNDALHWTHPGYLRSYSAGEAYEAGFHGGAPRFLLTTATAGAGLAAGTYQYAATWSVTDPSGKLARSALTLSDSVTVSGGNLQVTISVYSIAATERDRVNLELWRTLQDESGPYYLITSQVLPTNAYAANAVVTFVDAFADSAISGGPTLNQQPVGTLLPNDSTPAANWCAVAGDRLWCRDLEVPGRVRASKFRTDGVQTEMSPYLLVDQPEDAKGEVSRALAQQDGVFFLIGARTVSIFQGDGPDNTGAGGSFSPASLIPAAQGHLLEGGAVVTPVGILYVTDEGLGSLGRNQGIIDAVPAITAAYRDQGYQIAQIHHERSRSELWLIDPQAAPASNPRPGLPDPTTLVYSDNSNRWSAMAAELRSRSIAGNADDGLVIIRAAGAVWRRNLTLTADNGASYPLRLRTGWLQVGDLASAPVQWETLLLTANYRSAHQLTVSVRSDYSETVRVTYAVDMSGAPPAQLQYQIRLDELNLNANTIDVEISDDGAGAAWDFVQLTASYTQAAATNAMEVLPQARRFGVATRTAPV